VAPAGKSHVQNVKTAAKFVVKRPALPSELRGTLAERWQRFLHVASTNECSVSDLYMLTGETDMPTIEDVDPHFYSRMEQHKAAESAARTGSMGRPVLLYGGNGAASDTSVGSDSDAESRDPSICGPDEAQQQPPPPTSYGKWKRGLAKPAEATANKDTGTCNIQ